MPNDQSALAPPEMAAAIAAQLEGRWRGLKIIPPSSRSGRPSNAERTRSLLTFFVKRLVRG